MTNLKIKDFIRKNIFACLFSVHNTISLSSHEQVCLISLCFDRYFSHHQSFCQKVESYQYNVALAIRAAITGASQTKIYKILGLESLKFRRYFRRLCTFFKIQQLGLSSYLFSLVPQSNCIYNNGQSNKI